MARSRDRRARSRRHPPAPSTPLRDPRRERMRRVVIAFVLVIGLAGVLVLSAPADGDGAPARPPTAAHGRVG